MAERFRVLTALAEDSGLVPNTHTSFSGFHRHCTHMVH